MTLQRNLSNYLNATRRHRKQSITEFSEEIGIARSTLQDLLNGTCNPRMDTLQLIGDRLGVDPAELLSADYSKSQITLSLILLQTIEAFSTLPEEKLTTAAKLFHELILLTSDKG